MYEHRTDYLGLIFRFGSRSLNKGPRKNSSTSAGKSISSLSFDDEWHSMTRPSVFRTDGVSLHFVVTKYTMEKAPVKDVKGKRKPQQQAAKQAADFDGDKSGRLDKDMTKRNLKKSEDRDEVAQHLHAHERELFVMGGDPNLREPLVGTAILRPPLVRDILDKPAFADKRLSALDTEICEKHPDGTTTRHIPVRTRPKHAFELSTGKIVDFRAVHYCDATKNGGTCDIDHNAPKPARRMSKAQKVSG